MHICNYVNVNIILPYICVYIGDGAADHIGSQGRPRHQAKHQGYYHRYLQP